MCFLSSFENRQTFFDTLFVGQDVLHIAFVKLNSCHRHFISLELESVFSGFHPIKLNNLAKINDILSGHGFR